MQDTCNEFSLPQGNSLYIIALKEGKKVDGSKYSKYTKYFKSL